MKEAMSHTTWTMTADQSETLLVLCVLDLFGYKLVFKLKKLSSNFSHG